MLFKVYIIITKGRYGGLVLKMLDKNGAEIKGKNYEIKSYLFSVDARGRGILKFTGSDYETMIFRQISSCFADSSCTVFKNKDNVSFVVYNG